MALYYEYAELTFKQDKTKSFHVDAFLWSVEGRDYLGGASKNWGVLRDDQDNIPWVMSNGGLEAKRSYFLINCLSDTGWEPCGEGLWLKRQVVDPRPDIAILSEVTVMKKFPKLFTDGEFIMQMVAYHLTPTGRVELARSQWVAYGDGGREQLTHQLTQQLEGDGWRPSKPGPYCSTLYRPVKD